MFVLKQRDNYKYFPKLDTCTLMVSKIQTIIIKWSRWQWDFDYNYLSFLAYAQSNNFEKKMLVWKL